MYHTISEYVSDWKYENEATIKILKSLTDQSLSQKVNAEGRSLGFLAWHIVLTLDEMGSKAGLTIDAPPEDSPLPAHAKDIAAAYEKASASFISTLQNTWTDAMLSDKIDMYGQKWTREAALASLRVHQIHHRGQMTVLMRQAGLQVPGIYGPSREEWTQYGMKAPE